MEILLRRKNVYYMIRLLSSYGFVQWKTAWMLNTFLRYFLKLIFVPSLKYLCPSQQVIYLTLSCEDCLFSSEHAKLRRSCEGSEVVRKEVLVAVSGEEGCCFSCFQWCYHPWTRKKCILKSFCQYEPTPYGLHRTKFSFMQMGVFIGLWDGTFN